MFDGPPALVGEKAGEAGKSWGRPGRLIKITLTLWERRHTGH